MDNYARTKVQTETLLSKWGYVVTVATGHPGREAD